jgi:hypothetical protein
MTVAMIKLLRDVGPCVIFMNVCIVITVAMVILFRNSVSYGITSIHPVAISLGNRGGLKCMEQIHFFHSQINQQL